MLKLNTKNLKYKTVLKFFLILVILFAGLFALPRSVGAQEGPIFNCELGFTEIYDGISYGEFSATLPRNINWHIVKIDLNNDNIDFMVTPEANLGTNTSTFLSNFGADVAINGDLHWNLHDPAGLAASQGDEYSPPSPEPSFFINQENEISFFNRGGDPLWDAISGSHSIVRGGNVFDCEGPECTPIRPRTGVGIAGNTLIIMVVEGDRAGLPGVTLTEFAHMMLRCDTTAAINMDGGSSTTLVLGNEGVVAGSDATVANHFGVCIGGCSLAPDTRPFCHITDVRNNPGDNLFAGILTATVNYTVNFSCIFLTGAPPGNLCRGLSAQEGIEADCYPLPYDFLCEMGYGQVDCIDGERCGTDCRPLLSSSSCQTAAGSDSYHCVPDTWRCRSVIDEHNICPSTTPQCGADCTEPQSDLDPFESCVVNPYVRINTIVKTPLARQIWEKLVAGATGVFKRFPPKVEPGVSPIEYLNEIPAVSPVEYISLDGSTVVAGSPVTGRPGAEAEIYFPYIGGIHQYFLQCTQTLLRPRGFGPNCPAGTPPYTGPVPIGGPGGFCAESTSEYCSVSALQTPFGDTASIASQICNLESGGNPRAINTGCLTGTTYDYSVGLFQINLVPIPQYQNGVLVGLVDSSWRCPGAFVTDIDQVRPPFCLIQNQAILDECVQRFLNPEFNIATAWGPHLSNGGTYWCDWANAAEQCGIADCF